MKRSGFADLPLHGGRVPPWLAQRMEKIGTAIVESIVLHYGASELLSRIGDPYWFQAFGCVMGMDWHSSGITTSVLGALKRESTGQGSWHIRVRRARQAVPEDAGGIACGRRARDP